ncbi:MAG: hypothetical protein ACR2RL_26120, partial [Gammaproteobacteria bacterium]
VVALPVLLAFQSGAQAADPVGPKLTARLKELLTEEMQQVAHATGELVLAIAAGDHASAKQLGTAIGDSFILKKSLTAQDKKDLMGAVPPEFVALDRRFHATAGKLAHAAEMQDSELQSFYFAKMLEACMACHASFATDRFTGFGEGDAKDHKH